MDGECGRGAGHSVRGRTLPTAVPLLRLLPVLVARGTVANIDFILVFYPRMVVIVDLFLVARGTVAIIDFLYFPLGLSILLH